MSAGAKILLIDDDDILRHSLAKNLEKLGYHVTMAGDGEEGFALFGLHKFDLVISDIRMPRMDGIALTKKIREISKTPLILITGFSELLETQEAHRLGANEFLAKPFKREELQVAIARCLGTVSAKAEEIVDYGKIPIADFLTGRQIQFNIFLMLPSGRFVKIAHKGEDLSIDRIRAYEAKGIHHLFLFREDFRKYLGFSLVLTKAANANPQINKEKKFRLIKHTAEVLMIHVGAHGVDTETFNDAAAFLQTAIDVMSDDPQLLSLMEILRDHSDFHYAHSLGVSFYGVAMAKAIGWELPQNRLKVAMSGLFHDIGEKEIGLDVLVKPRANWSLEELKLYESHTLRGVNILSSVPSVAPEVLQVVREHHEDCLSQGFPSRLKRSQIIPMAKLIAVADQFCDLTVANPQSATMAPREAIERMSIALADRIERKYFDVLKQFFSPSTSSVQGSAG